MTNLGTRCPPYLSIYIIIKKIESSKLLPFEVEVAKWAGLAQWVRIQNGLFSGSSHNGFVDQKHLLPNFFNKY